MRHRFPDGDAVDQDPRREDPLVYYVPGGDWSRAIAFEIDPPYEEHRATEVTTRVWAKQQASLTGLDTAAMTQVVARLVEVLSRQYPRWKVWKSEWPPSLVARVGISTLQEPFVRAGWRQVASPDTSALSWER